MVSQVETKMVHCYHSQYDRREFRSQGEVFFGSSSGGDKNHFQIENFRKEQGAEGIQRRFVRPNLILNAVH